MFVRNGTQGYRVHRVIGYIGLQGAQGYRVHRVMSSSGDYETLHSQIINFTILSYSHRNTTRLIPLITVDTMLFQIILMCVTIVLLFDLNHLLVTICIYSHMNVFLCISVFIFKHVITNSIYSVVIFFQSYVEIVSRYEKIYFHLALISCLMFYIMQFFLCILVLSISHLNLYFIMVYQIDV